MKKYKLSRGVFIAVEGVDGAGKTTQVMRLKEHFYRKGIPVSTFKEPTDGRYGQMIRQIGLIGRHLYTPDEELDLFLSDRKEDLEKNIIPAIQRKELVIIDRYYFSNIAYQGALGVDKEHILIENEKIALKPDLVIILNCAVRVGLSRIRNSRNETPNHFEKEEYLEDVKKIFLSMSGPAIQIIDSTPDEDTVFNHVKNIVQDVIAPFTYPIEEQTDLFAVDPADQQVTFSKN